MKDGPTDYRNEEPPDSWPWALGWWKPGTDPIRNLEKAGALIAAEIDRLLRKRAPPDTPAEPVMDAQKATASCGTCGRKRFEVGDGIGIGNVPPPLCPCDDCDPPCPSCGGDGSLSPGHAHEERCSTCGGSGEVRREGPVDWKAEPETEPCPDCKGGA